MVYESLSFLLLVLIACGIFSFGGLVEARSPSLVYPISHSGGLKANSSGLIYPFARRYGMTSPFGWRNHPIKKDRRFHAGMDIGAPSGTPVLAAAAGRVVRSGPWGDTAIPSLSNIIILLKELSTLIFLVLQWEAALK